MIDQPTYRVTFWASPPGARPEDGVQWGANAEEWTLTAAVDVHEVLAWAERNASGRAYEVLAEFPDQYQDTEGVWRERVGVVRLTGYNPTSADQPPVEARVSRPKDQRVTTQLLDALGRHNPGQPTRSVAPLFRREDHS